MGENVEIKTKTVVVLLRDAVVGVVGALWLVALWCVGIGLAVGLGYRAFRWMAGL